MGVNGKNMGCWGGGGVESGRVRLLQSKRHQKDDHPHLDVRLEIVLSFHR